MVSISKPSVGQPGSPSALGADCRGFKSLHSDQFPYAKWCNGSHNFHSKCKYMYNGYVAQRQEATVSKTVQGGFESHRTHQK